MLLSLSNATRDEAVIWKLMKAFSVIALFASVTCKTVLCSKPRTALIGGAPVGLFP